MGTDAVIEVRNLEKVYPGGIFSKVPVAALSGISFRIGKGELMGLLGPNGAGKTTTVKILAGLVTQTGGEALILGRSANDPEARRAMGYMPERASPPEYLIGVECLDREGQMFDLPRSERTRRAAMLLERVKLPASVSSRKVASYSKGERARLGLALALMPMPQVILLDEPTDGLDPVGRAEVRDLLVQLKSEGRAILLNSHLLSEAELCCDHVSILAQGRVVAAGKTNELLATAGGKPVIVIRTQPACSEDDLAKLAAIGAARREGDAVLVTLESDADVDKVVDTVRGRGLSLRELSQKKTSLEQFFLQTVLAPPGMGAAPPPIMPPAVKS